MSQRNGPFSRSHGTSSSAKWCSTSATPGSYRGGTQMVSLPYVSVDVAGAPLSAWSDADSARIYTASSPGGSWDGFWSRCAPWQRSCRRDRGTGVWRSCTPSWTHTGGRDGSCLSWRKGSTASSEGTWRLRRKEGLSLRRPRLLRSHRL